MTIRVACLAMGAVGGTDLGRLDSHVPDASAGRCAAAFDGLAADYPTHRGIASQPVCVIHIFISGETTIDGLAQQTDDPVPAVLARPTVGKHRTRERGQAKGIIEFTIGKQPGIGCDPRAVELELQAAIEVEAQRRHIGFTLWVPHLTHPPTNPTY